MKKKLIIILSSIVLFILIFFISFYFVIKLSFKLNGEKNKYINVFSNYQDEGAYIKDFKFLNKYIKVKNDVDTNVIGTYEYKYTFKYFFKSITLKRNIFVIDNESPSITLNGDEEITICKIEDFKESGYAAYDNYDGDITNNVIVTNDFENIIYNVTDSSGNNASAFRKITIKDNEKPKLTLKGKKTIYVKLNEEYNDDGAIVSDNCDSNIKINLISNNVDITKKGTYYVKYSATDLAGNAAYINRKVIVYDPNEELGYIYLTFDDGPSDSGTTAKILDVLKQYNVKATFFVTGYGSDDLITREFNEGHVVALHTYTHKWENYTSIESYFNDLDKIKERVYNLTGINQNIIRFPGGSNNTVSNRYNNGIMDTLTVEVLNRGYKYIDWNVSAGDAGGCSTSTCVYNNIVNNLSYERNNIVLMHDSKKITANALSDIINYAITNGFSFKTISEDMNMVRFK